MNIVIDPVKVQEMVLAQVKANRKAAYVAESDPLFFKVQRGEATQDEWLAKIAEIKNRYPDPNEEAQA